MGSEATENLDVGHPATFIIEATAEQEPPPKRLRLRSTPLSEPEEKFDLEVAKLQLTTSFRSLALKLIGSAETTELAEYRKLSSLIEKWSTAPLTSKLEDLRKLLRSEIEGCHGFFTSYRKTVYKHFRKCSYLSLDQLEKLEEELKENLKSCLEHFQQDKDYLRILCEGTLTNMISTIKFNNKEIIKTEELLADTACDRAFTAYTVSMDRQLQETIWSANDVHIVHQEFSSRILTIFTSELTQDTVVWRPRIEYLTLRMEQYFEKLVAQNAERLSKFHQHTMNAFESCKNVFDRLFARKSEFTSLGDVKIEGEAALTGTFEKLKEQKDQLQQAGITGVRQMLKNFAFKSMLQCAPNSQSASAVLARKSHVTIIFDCDETFPIKIYSESLEEPIWMDPHLWFHDGNLTIMSSQAQRPQTNGQLCESLSVIELTDGMYFDDQRYKDLLAAIGNCTHPEQVVAVYFKKLKHYLLEHYHLIPTELTVVVDDVTEFVSKNRLNSGIRLAELPSPNFMGLTGAVAAGYLKNDKFNQISKTLLLIATGTGVFSAKFEVNECIRNLPRASECVNGFDEIYNFFVEQVQKDRDSQQLVVIHDLQSTNFDALKKHLPERITRCHIDYVSASELQTLTFRGAAEAQRLFDVAYCESFRNNVFLRPQNQAPRKLVASDTCVQQNICELSTINAQDIESGNFSWKLEVEYDFFEYTEDFEFRVTAPAGKLTSIWRLRKDGILCAPEIFTDNPKLTVDWEMTGPLMPLNHPDFQQLTDPQCELWKLAVMEKEPIRLKRTPSGNNVNSTASPVAQLRPCLESNAAKNELKKLMEQLEHGLHQQPLVGVAVAKKARSKLVEAKNLLESEGVQTLETIQMGEILKTLLDIVNDSASA